MSDAAQQRSKELRLATVLYGGTSLCIYMHGVTKELSRLVRASDRSLPRDALSTEEKTYRDLLDELAEKNPSTRVVVDVVSGTSAGGINGIFLAKALAHDLSLDPLRKLWIEEGDVRKLARGLGNKAILHALGLPIGNRLDARMRRTTGVDGGLAAEPTALPS